MGLKISKALFDKLQELAHSYIDEETGKEMLNPIPKDLRVGIDTGDSLQEQVARAISIELDRQASLQEYETLADANNFDLRDDMAARLSGYEYDEETLASLPPMADDEFTETGNTDVSPGDNLPPDADGNPPVTDSTQPKDPPQS
jgi:hypothetical protein